MRGGTKSPRNQGVLKLYCRLVPPKTESGISTGPERSSAIPPVGPQVSHVHLARGPPASTPFHLSQIPTDDLLGNHAKPCVSSVIVNFSIRVFLREKALGLNQARL